MPSSERIAERLRHSMQSRGLSSAQLARKAGVNTSFLYDLLRGKSHNPSIVRLSKVAEVLDVSLSYLVEENPGVVPEMPGESFGHYVDIPFIGDEHQHHPATIRFHRQWLEDQQMGLPQDLRLYKLKHNEMKSGLQKGSLVIVNVRLPKRRTNGIFLLHEKGVWKVCYLEAADNSYSIHTRLIADGAIIGRIVWESRRVK